MGDGVGHQPDFAAAFQKARDGALYAVFGEHTVDEALVDVKMIEEREHRGVAEEIQLVLLDEDLFGFVGQQRGHGFLLTNSADDAVRGPDFELFGVLSVGAHTGDQRDAVFARVLV